MEVVCDIETERLENPNEIHIIVCRDVNSDSVYEFERPHESPNEFVSFSKGVSKWIGHHFLGFDYRAIRRLIPEAELSPDRITDTHVVSRLLNYGIEGGHSLEAWGHRLHCEKVGIDIADFSVLTPLLRKRCVQDTAVNKALYLFQKKYLDQEHWKSALETEHYLQLLCNELHDTGFPFDEQEAVRLRAELADKLRGLDLDLERAFPPRAEVLGVVEPRITKLGALNRSDFRWHPSPDLTAFNGGPFTRFAWAPFNPGSVKQIVERLNDAGWKPTEKTQGHIKALRERPRPSRERLERYRIYGWTVSEANLRTLPEGAPLPAKRLAQRILLASRLSDLDEWLGLSKEGVIHGDFTGIGAWTQRMSHQRPNMANIPVAKRKKDSTEFETYTNDINDRMRKLFYAPKGWRLIGTDATGIQMRLFAHYANNPELTEILTSGRDIHEFHIQALGSFCRGRDPSKRFLYAWILGAGLGKVQEILECSAEEAKGAIDNFLKFYPALGELKKERIPRDVKRGYFEGLDGRYVVTPPDAATGRAYLLMSGYLQNGEKVVMARAAKRWTEQVSRARIPIPYRFVNFVHDEWQTLVPDEDDAAQEMALLQQNSIIAQGVELSLNCPLDAGSKFGYSWKETH